MTVTGRFGERNSWRERGCPGILTLALILSLFLSRTLTLGRADARDTLWPGHFHRYRGGRAPDFEERWQNHTELSLRSASPGGADTVEAACGPVAGAVA